MNNKVMKCLSVFFCALFLISGCQIRKEEDLSGTVTELVQEATKQFINSSGFGLELRLVSIDLSAIEGVSTREYGDWIQENYADDNTLILVFSEENEADAFGDNAREYLRQNGYEEFADSDYDWTSISFRRDSKSDEIEASELLHVAINYPYLPASEGFEVQMEYSDGAWEVEDVESTYMS